MDLQSQEAILRLAETHGKDNVVVILGAPDPEAAEISAETVRLGDPAYAGALAGVQLGLDVYHVLDDEVRVAHRRHEHLGERADVVQRRGLFDRLGLRGR